jgi:hypothetical protein
MPKRELLKVKKKEIINVLPPQLIISEIINSGGTTCGLLSILPEGKAEGLYPHVSNREISPG